MVEMHAVHTNDESLRTKACTPVNYWLRNPNTGNTNNVANVNTSGQYNNNNANNSNGFSPDCTMTALTHNTKVCGNTEIEERQKSTGELHVGQTSQVQSGKSSCQPSSTMQDAKHVAIDYGICSFESLWKSALKCKRGVGWKDSVVQYFMRGAKNVCTLYFKLMKHQYKILKYMTFTLQEKKPRKIYSTHLPDRIFQRSLCDNKLYDEVSKMLIYDNGACLKHRGTSFAQNRFKRFLGKHWLKHKDAGYSLKIDIKNYFGSIPHENLKSLLHRKLKSDFLKQECDRIIDSYPDMLKRSASQIKEDPFGKRGLGLGSQTSQLFALLYLDEVDRLVKSKLRVRHYIRYMDDMILLHESKSFLQKCRSEIIDAIESLGLEVSQHKTRLQPLKQGVTFLKVTYRFNKHGKIKTRISRDVLNRQLKRTTVLMRKLFEKKIKLKDVVQAFNCWKACSGRFASKGQLNKVSKYIRGKTILWQR